MSTASDILVRPDGDRGLYLTICISGCIHLGMLGVLAFAHPNFLEHPRIESYTVDLVSPSTVGGTNLSPGGAQSTKPEPPKTAAQPAVQLPAPAPPKPVPAPEPKAPAVPPAPPVAKVEPKPPPPAPPPPKPAEVKPEPKPEVAAAKPEPKAEPKPPPPKPEAAVKPKPNLPQPEPPKSTQPEKPPKAAAKPEPPKPAAEAKKELAKVERPPEPAHERDRRIADAIDQRAKQMRETESAAAKSLDSRIEAAVQRRVQEVGSGTQPGAGSGPISFGPGTGAGGIVKGVEYILYRNQMEARIKAAWAWAGANRSLKALVRFNILPSGEIANVQVIEPSGDPAYDMSIERALRAVSPLDPPPERYREEFSTVELEFRPEDIKS